MNCLSTVGFFKILDQLDGPLMPVRKGKRMLLLRSEHLRFLDLRQFTGSHRVCPPVLCYHSHMHRTGPGSYRDLCKEIIGEDSKSYFPYESMCQLDDVHKGLPSYDDYKDTTRKVSVELVCTLDVYYKTYCTGSLARRTTANVRTGQTYAILR